MSAFVFGWMNKQEREEEMRNEEIKRKKRVEISERKTEVSTYRT